MQPASWVGSAPLTYLSSHTCSSRVVLPPPQQLCVSSEVCLKLPVYFSASLSSLFSSLGCNCTQLNPRLLNTSPTPPHHLSTCLKHIEKRISSALIAAFFVRTQQMFRRISGLRKTTGKSLVSVGSHNTIRMMVLVSTTCWWLPKKVGPFSFLVGK